MGWTPDRDASGAFIIRTGAFTSTEGMRFRGTGISGTATAGQTTNIDYQLTENRYINGVQIIAKNHVFGDSLDFQVVDKDGIMAPAGTVLDVFGSNWYLSEDVQAQQQVLLSYPALVYQGLYIRIVYKSVGAANVDVKVNMFLHKKPT